MKTIAEHEVRHELEASGQGREGIKGELEEDQALAETAVACAMHVEAWSTPVPEDGELESSSQPKTAMLKANLEQYVKGRRCKAKLEAKRET